MMKNKIDRLMENNPGLKKKLKIAAYLLSVLLVAGYITILVLSINDTGDYLEYYMYYISDELARYVPVGELQNYVTDVTYNYYSDDGLREAGNMGKGFTSTDKGGTWTIGNKSELYFYVDNPEYDYTFAATIPLNAGYNNYLCVNGEKVDDIKIVENGFYIRIPSKYFINGQNIISFETDEKVQRNCDHVPGSKDERKLNLYIKYAGLYLSDTYPAPFQE